MGTAACERGRSGRHWAVFWSPAMGVNIPLGGHSILVMGLGRLSRRGRFHRWQVCAYRMDLEHCCGRG